MGMINTLVSEENLSPEQKKEYNYKLFAFYNSMIAPLQMLENLAANRNMENAKLYELKIKPFPA